MGRTNSSNSWSIGTGSSSVSDSFDNPVVMMDAYERHNEAVRQSVPADRLLEWTATDGLDPICGRLGLEVPSEPFPVTNTTDEVRAMVGMPAIS